MKNLKIQRNQTREPSDRKSCTKLSFVKKRKMIKSGKEQLLKEEQTITQKVVVS